MKHFWNIWEWLLTVNFPPLPVKFHMRLWKMMPDNCQVCHGSNGGVRGNENLINGVVMCDYCHAKEMR